MEQDTDADFPPPPDFEDTQMQRRECRAKILVDPNAKQSTVSLMNIYDTGLSGILFNNEIACIYIILLKTNKTNLVSMEILFT